MNSLPQWFDQLKQTPFCKVEGYYVTLKHSKNIKLVQGFVMADDRGQCLYSELGTPDQPISPWRFVRGDQLMDDLLRIFKRRIQIYEQDIHRFQKADTRYVFESLISERAKRKEETELIDKFMLHFYPVSLRGLEINQLFESTQRLCKIAPDKLEQTIGLNSHTRRVFASGIFDEAFEMADDPVRRKGNYAMMIAQTLERYFNWRLMEATRTQLRIRHAKTAREVIFDHQRHPVKGHQVTGSTYILGTPLFARRSRSYIVDRARTTAMGIMVWNSPIYLQAGKAYKHYKKMTGLIKRDHRTYKLPMFAPNPGPQISQSWTKRLGITFTYQPNGIPTPK